MIQIIPSKDRHHADHGWLSTHWHFSFGDYHEPDNMHWGALRVFNDDIIQGGGGFGMHPHRDMEIVTVVLAGALEHQDSIGSRGVIRPGEVQMMSAGRGIFHSEMNPSPDEPCHLLQLWILPRKRGTPPRYGQKVFSPADRRGKLLPVVSSGDMPGTLAIDQDATIFLSTLGRGDRLTHTTPDGRFAYLFVIKGAIKLNDRKLSEGDQARVAGRENLTISAEGDAELILLDLPPAD